MELQLPHYTYRATVVKVDEVDPEGEGANDPDFMEKFKIVANELEQTIKQRLSR